MPRQGEWQVDNTGSYAKLISAKSKESRLTRLDECPRHDLGDHVDTIGIL